ncbi:superinfection immunity protein [Janibacter cremeus]|uniref:Type VI protein secretion system component VasK n=1 Tax=Janibacter cremeus TaxID=1285192 RepID=A0A852VKZ9_9MICO|nr:superinfection immunity protein [Janibacter cremeus]NYF96736.1 type VI protein secretion system component VasK [Janibacter cremeus]
MPRIVTDQKTRVVSAPVAVLVAILSAGYMLPWAIAAVRGTHNAWTVFWVNLLLGWTVVGWIVALVMSIREHRILAVR